MPEEWTNCWLTSSGTATVPQEQRAEVSGLEGRGSVLSRLGDAQSVAASDGPHDVPAVLTSQTGDGRIGLCVLTGRPSPVPGAVPGAPSSKVTQWAEGRAGVLLLPGHSGLSTREEPGGPRPASVSLSDRTSPFTWIQPRCPYLQTGESSITHV